MNPLTTQSLVSNKAIDFNCQAIDASGQIIDDFHFFEAIKNKYAVLFFYPLNFTFVCPTEMIRLNQAMGKLKALNVEVFTVSVDSHFSHLQWRQMPLSEGGIGEVQYTMLSDINHEIMNAYNAKHTEKSIALRATVIIDTQGKIRHHGANDLQVGRNIEEIVRLVEALKHADTYGEVCPAGWSKGKESIQENKSSVSQYLVKHEQNKMPAN